MHAHWGDKEGVGSEHTVDGAPYDAELHIVHFNTKYGSPGDAFDKEDGLVLTSSRSEGRSAKSAFHPRVRSTSGERQIWPTSPSFARRLLRL